MGCGVIRGSENIDVNSPKPIVMPNSIFKYDLKGEWTHEGWDEW